ncbi:MAG: WbqC family protein [Bacteroidales bacterium]|jgi:hypothetical protein|nr:WbqC family protein [Bacteroidales bacterium]
MDGTILLSTAYLPPPEYFAHIMNSCGVLIEREENYLKQSFRNRCYILSAYGPQVLTVPVYLGSFHKTPVKDIRIDYSKRWQQVHLGAMTSSYNSSPFFLYYFETIEKIIQTRHEFLLDLNLELLEAILKIINIDISISYTSEFMPVKKAENDHRYLISPKKKSAYISKRYLQVFNPAEGFIAGLSIIDLVFNTGPEAKMYL